MWTLPKKVHLVVRNAQVQLKAPHRVDLSKILELLFVKNALDRI